ncbi:MAG: GFA family protein [Pseudomonadota bacterium]
MNERAANPSLPLGGGCQCQKLRYEISAPPLMIYCCHCTNCQRATGGAFVVAVTILEPSLTFVKGEPAKTFWTSDAGNSRVGYYCGDCGARIANGGEPSIGVLSLRGGTFDDTSWLRPAGHIWTKSAQPWMKFDDAMILTPGQPADYAPFMEHFKAQKLFEG